MASVATVFNVLIIYYHVSNPPHPKFLLVPKRWWSIRTHLVTGIIEITASVAGLVAANVYGGAVTTYSRFAAPAGVIHSLTALYQTNLVFGARIIMHPAYYSVGYMHLVAAVATAAAPKRESRLLAQYCVLCIFTWCRVYMVLLQRINLASPCIYSISIVLAGLTCGPIVLGPLAVVYFCVFLYLSAVLWAWCGRMDPYGTDWEELTRERVRSELLDGAAMAAWRGLPPNATKADSDAAAERAFRRLDTDGSGLIEMDEAMKLLGSLRVHSSVRRAMLSLLERTGGVDYLLFLRSIWNLGVRTGYESPSLAELAAMTTPLEQAKAVFDSIDLDRSGVLERFELAELLVQWGCPDDEVNAYLEHIDGNNDGQISFEDEFFPDMQPIWKFGFETVLHHKAQMHARRGWAAGDEATSPRGSAGALQAGTPRASLSTGGGGSTAQRVSLSRAGKSKAA